MGAHRSVNVINCLVFPHVAMVPLLLASQKELTGIVPSCSASVQVITSTRGQRDRDGGSRAGAHLPPQPHFHQEAAALLVPAAAAQASHCAEHSNTNFLLLCPPPPSPHRASESKSLEMAGAGLQ